MKEKWNYCYVLCVNETLSWHRFDCNVPRFSQHDSKAITFRQIFKIDSSILPSTIWTWKKKNNKIFESYEKELNSKSIKPEVLGTTNKDLMKRLLNLRSWNIPMNGLLLKEKASDFAKELGVTNFQVSDGWLVKGKKR